MHEDIDETTPLTGQGAKRVCSREHRKKLRERISAEQQRDAWGEEGHRRESTPVDEVKAPNVFERTKEEIDALVQMIDQKKDAKQEVRLRSQQPSPMGTILHQERKKGIRFYQESKGRH
ncbi:hypothetical protein MLD38_006554 [Melastoma candidum]|uniref:Uncharacterized protein n=1 Tax=Melastoma candidum TaxID=119954 RepID=A0ACB9RMT5_9MYRT|nr:hypothetical protein MLD38_006554 [Melastoma candidum]